MKKIKNKSKKIKKTKKSDNEISFAYKYLCILTKEQIITLLQWGGACRFLYNLAKEERELRHEQNKNRPESQREYTNKYEQMASLVDLKKMEGMEFLKDVPSQVLQQVLSMLENSFQRFFDGDSDYPNWKTRNNNGVQLKFPDGPSVKVNYLNKNNASVNIPKLGDIRFKTGGRRIPKNARIRSMNIKGNSSGTEFRISFNLGINKEEVVIPNNQGEAVGIDRGVVISMQLSNGKQYHLPKALIKKQEKKLKKAQKRLARMQKPKKDNPEHKAKNYKKQQEKIRKIHKKIKNTRLDFNHKSTTEIAKSHSMVVIEDLKLKNLTASASGTLANPGTNVSQKSGLNKSLLNEGMYQQEQMYKYKCIKFGFLLVKVPAKNSSRECSVCGFISKKNRKSQSEFECIKCGHAENADLNASKVILARGHRVLACGEDVSETKKLVSKNSSKNSKEKKSGTIDRILATPI